MKINSTLQIFSAFFYVVACMEVSVVLALAFAALTAHPWTAVAAQTVVAL